jgi:hypothetical protein
MIGFVPTDSALVEAGRMLKRRWLGLIERHQDHPGNRFLDPTRDISLDGATFRWSRLLRLQRARSIRLRAAPLSPLTMEPVLVPRRFIT